MYQTSEDSGVDGAADENDWQGNTKRDAADRRSSREQRRALDFLADKGINQRAGHSVDKDLCCAQSVDGLHEIRGCAFRP